MARSRERAGTAADLRLERGGGGGSSRGSGSTASGTSMTAAQEGHLPRFPAKSSFTLKDLVQAEQVTVMAMRLARWEGD